MESLGVRLRFFKLLSVSKPQGELRNKKHFLPELQTWCPLDMYKRSLGRERGANPGIYEMWRSRHYRVVSVCFSLQCPNIPKGPKEKKMQLSGT